MSKFLFEDGKMVSMVGNSKIIQKEDSIEIKFNKSDEVYTNIGTYDELHRLLCSDVILKKIKMNNNTLKPICTEKITTRGGHVYYMGIQIEFNQFLKDGEAELIYSNGMCCKVLIEIG